MPKLIYVVEDDPLTSSLLKTTLSKKPDTQVITFDDATQALSACGKQVPNVLIIDYQLPGMSGIELFDALKGGLPPSTLVIMASAIDDGAMVLQFIRKGIRNYVIKDENFIPSILETIDEHT
jgi:DNA-binding NarL/FixJ family response regulator